MITKSQTPIGTKVYATGNVGGTLPGTVVGYTAGGMYRVLIDADSPYRAGETVRSSWVAER